MKSLTLIALACLISAMTATSYGFVEKRPPGAQFSPEHTQELVEQQQALSGKYGVLGSEDLVQPQPQVKVNDGIKKAGEIEIQANPAAQSVAESALVKAEADRKNQGRPKTSFTLWGLAFLALGAAAVWAFKSYADRVVPEMPATPRSKTKW